MAEKREIKYTVHLIGNSGQKVVLRRLFTENEFKDGKPRVIAHAIVANGAYYNTTVGSHVVIAPNQIERVVWFDSAQDEMNARFSVKASLASG